MYLPGIRTRNTLMYLSVVYLVIMYLSVKNVISNFFFYI